METALYFPYIRVPATAWFTQVLLYWDAAASIVPSNMRNYETELGSYMEELIRADLVNPIRPGYVPRKKSREYDETFLALLDAQELAPIFTKDIRSNKREIKLHPERSSRLHMEKASYQLFNNLMERGLATQLSEGYSEWWTVENKTGELYMAYFVGSICREHPDLYPVTDTSDNMKRLIAPAADLPSRLGELRYTTITEALPAPSGPVSVAELKRFRDHHGEQLSSLRRYLNMHLLPLAEIDDDEYRDQMSKDALQVIREEVTGLTKKMRKRRWPNIMLMGVGGLVASSLTIGATIATGGAALAIGLGVAGAVVSTGMAGKSTIDLIRRPRFDEHAPLAYAALAQAL